MSYESGAASATACAASAVERTSPTTHRARMAGLWSKLRAPIRAVGVMALLRAARIPRSKRDAAVTSTTAQALGR